MKVAEQVRGHAQVAGAPGLRDRSTNIEAIFEQARRRRKRRQLACLVTVGVLLAAAAAIGLTVGGGGGNDAVRGGDGGRVGAAAQSHPARLGQPAVQLAWIDSDGQLNIGDPATWALQVVPTIGANSSAPVVYAAGHLYWAEANRAAPIRDYDLATGKIRYLAPGEAVFSSADGQSLYVARTAVTLLELPADGVGKAAVFRTPAGWYVSGIGPDGVPTAAAGGVIVSSSKDLHFVPRGARVGLWNPDTGQVRILGIGIQIFGVYTPPGGGYSLLAWEPPIRGTPRDWSFRITKTSTMATITVPSQLHHAFADTGVASFSPGGAQMAVFVKTARLRSGNGMSRLAIVNVKTGASRLVPGTALSTNGGAYSGGDTYWALWLPGGRQILAGAVANCVAASAYAVDTRKLGARPFSFFEEGTDGFSAIVLR